jgi:hypothetical protein
LRSQNLAHSFCPIHIPSSSFCRLIVSPGPDKPAF